jgi:WXXGXW repeat (2 copies)
MNYQSFEISPKCRILHEVRKITKHGMAIAQAMFLCISASEANGQQNETPMDDQGAQVLTRGPVHEAFAGVVSYNPEPGIIVDRAPPEAIEELPPSERPEGDNINWIPGYWAWDDERSDHLWVSGTWRALPPGRQWTTGYWGQSGTGHQWTSGYWADASARETTYLPRPPVTVEVGPNVAAPSRDHVWSPGSWAWQQERYAWRPGYWAEGRSDWDWTPAHYVWTPRGHVYVDGFWDYSVQRRGVLYAPVHFQAGYYSRPGYQYSPVVAIGLGALVDHLFLRPTYHHYYFGDYYDRRYGDNGYYSPQVYQSRRFGYDPVYSYQRWSHREDNDWERRHLASYDYRRDHESARPPRTWNDQRRLKMDKYDEKERRNYQMGTQLERDGKLLDGKTRLQTVSKTERQQIADQGREIRNNRDQRRVQESEGINNKNEQSEREMKPTKVKRSASPIVGKSRDQLSGAQAPPNSRREQNDTKQKEPTDRKSDSDQTRPDAKKEQPVSRREDDPKVKEPQDKTNPKTKQEQPPDRRDTEKEPDRKNGPDTNRPDSKKEQPSSRKESDSKANEPNRMPSPDKDRSETKQEQPPRRRVTAKDPAPKQNPDKIRPENKKQQLAPRPEAFPKGIEPGHKDKQESKQKADDTSARQGEQRKPKESESRNQKTSKQSEETKSKADEEDSELSNGKARSKK